MRGGAEGGQTDGPRPTLHISMQTQSKPNSLTQTYLLPILYAILILLMVGLPRLTEFWGYAIVDEPDRWRWAEEFAWALHRGDMAATLVGDGYPGIVPVWAENIWIYAEMARRSWREGQWIGEPGLYQLLHQWERTDSLHWQRLPIVILNSLLALTVIMATWRLFGRTVGLLAGLLIALDPFYLSDSRVNRAEALITGLMTLSILSLMFYAQSRRWIWVLISGLLGGLSLLTKIQALVLLPAVGLIGVWIYGGVYSHQTVATAKAVALQKKRRFWSAFPFPSVGVGRKQLWQSCQLTLLWATIALLTWVALWPAMWVVPLETLTLVFNYTTRKVGQEGVNLFFWGQTYRDSGPSWLFYPVVFLFRTTPLTLLGLLMVCLTLIGRMARSAPPSTTCPQPQVVNLSPFPIRVLKQCSLSLSTAGWFRQAHPAYPNKAETVPALSPILLIYILSYSLPMTLGSHKQDRYLMPIFLAVNILAALGLRGLWRLIFARWSGYMPRRAAQYAFILLLLFQIGLIYPHHPYYFSYFNPLFGGGQAATKTLRIGWGEGMDKVGAYLAAKPNGNDLVVATRFTHNMLGFKGEAISLVPNGRWTQADYIVLYIQQVQRYQEPSREFLDYFLAREPEQTITLNGIDYARIYPRPFSVPADPTRSRLEGQVALFGYRWQAIATPSTTTPPATQTLRLVWQNLGLAPTQTLVTRLVGLTTQSEWHPCQPDTAFMEAARTPNRFVESRCPVSVSLLSSGTYTVEFGLSGTAQAVRPIFFPNGWQAARRTASGLMTDTSLTERFEQLAAQALPETAQRTERIYHKRLRVVGYTLNPTQPNPGDAVTVTLYWQKLAELLEPLSLTVQLADSRSLPLGRHDQTLPVNGWIAGAIVPTHHDFKLAETLADPLAALLEVKLFNQADIQLAATDPTGQPLPDMTTRFTIGQVAPAEKAAFMSAVAHWQDNVTLLGYRVSADPLRAGDDSLQVELLWQAEQPIRDNYVTFVHLLDPNGQLISQHDSLPHAGAYPMPWWPPQTPVVDSHSLTIPADRLPGDYRLLIGVYDGESLLRLPLESGGDRFELGAIEVVE